MSDAVNEFLSLPIHCRELFTPAECAEIRALPTAPGAAAQVDSQDHRAGQNDRIRRTTVFTLPAMDGGHWLQQRLELLLQTVNQRYFHFQLSRLSSLQLLAYGPGDFFELHADLGPGDASSRKLSLIVFLSPREDYAGGELLLGAQGRPVEQVPGHALVFPSYLVHRITPVTRGQRLTLVGWAHGRPFV